MRRDTAEHQRLRLSAARQADWKNWGPYVSDRAWGTVREDFGPDSDPWSHFTHDQARSRAYRWNEDGIAGFCNRFQNICVAWAFWNEQDPYLKERLFGLTGPQGNHGEDCKEYYFYVDALPSHAYNRMLYRYPQVAFPYDDLVRVNAERSAHDPEYELIDALGEAFAQRRYFDIEIEYAKADQEDILCRVTAWNRADNPAPLHLLPHVWFRNSWSWRHKPDRPSLQVEPSLDAAAHLQLNEKHLGQRYWYARTLGSSVAPALLVTENATNAERCFGQPSVERYVKDGIHRAVCDGETAAVNPAGRGTKAAAHAQAVVPPGEALRMEFRLSDRPHEAPFDDAEPVLQLRRQEADAYYAAIQPAELPEESRRVQREAWAGLLWSKQFYHYSVELWCQGDGTGWTDHPKPRRRNTDWKHLYNLDVLSMPDKWEYPWYAAWDLAFHTLPLAQVDPEWAKRQLILMLREWYMHPNGQIPAYEWSLGDVNPPVHAWAAWQVYRIDRDVRGRADLDFLEKVFHKLLLNFTWWVNRKDRTGDNIFEGGFLGLDNIGLFDRSAPLPDGSFLEQSDGTAWMGMYSVNLLRIALELAQERPVYEDVATKFFEHFVYIADALNHEQGLWDDDDGFFYDRLRTEQGPKRLKIKSFVGLIPLFATEVLEERELERLPRFRRRMEWFLRYRPHMVDSIASLTEAGQGGRRLLALVPRERLERVLARMLDEQQFLSAYGLRSLSREHRDQPYQPDIPGFKRPVVYEPAESSYRMFGGNSNWRGPVWFPLNYLMIESLRSFHAYYGDSLQTACPTADGPACDLNTVADELSRRLIALFRTGGDGRRPFYGGVELFQRDELWNRLTLFYEYFHGDNGAGIGASHQTGWTALVAMLIQQCSGRSLAETDAATERSR